MGLRSFIFLVIEVILGLLLYPFIGPPAILIGLGLAGTTYLLGRRARRNAEKQPATTSQKPMSFRRFLGLLWIVALVAILYSPSSLRYSAGGGSPTALAESFHAIQPYLKDIESKYKVTIVNDTSSFQQALSQHGRKAYFLIGPDQQHPLTAAQSQLISNEYLNGTLSLLVSDGNTTNNAFLESLFHAQVKGDAIVEMSDHNPFETDYPANEVFNVTAAMDGKTVGGVIDVGSPIMIGDPNMMWTMAASSYFSSEKSVIQNITADQTVGPRTVVGASEINGDRAILISDSGPFSAAYNVTDLQYGINETSFAMALSDWVTHSDPTTTIIIDNMHYTPPVTIPAPAFGLNLPVGRLFAIFLSFWITFTGNLYTGFLNTTRQFILGVAIFTAWGLYGTITKRYATERRGKDDEPVPVIEKSIVAESKQRIDFLTTSRNKGFYVATLNQLYDVLDSLVEREFGAGVSTIKPEQLTARLGEQNGTKAAILFKRLEILSRYARGGKRFIFPPIVRWERTTRMLTGETEEILNQLGLTMTGEGQKKQLDYKLRRC